MAGLAALVLVLLAACRAFAADAPLRASAFDVDVGKGRTTVKIAFDRDPQLNWSLLGNPYRVVVDLPRAAFAFDPRSLKPSGLLAGVRYGDNGQDRSRIILTARSPFNLANAAVQPTAEGKGGFVLELALEQTSRKEFDAALLDQNVSTAAIAAPNPAADAGKFLVVIDPGHGGIDGGAKSPGGTVEKDVTLAFSKALQEKLEKTGRYRTLLTRDGDVFIPLNDRVAFAREKGAQLFISIHADTIRVKALRGATVYTVSDEASDAESAELADRENLADAIGGIEIKEENQQVADILVDLIRRETHSFSVSFARSLVGELRRTVLMISNPHRQAGFRVLRAPDIPSVLVELGYLSNVRDEAQLRSDEWRSRTADSIVAAVDAFARTTRPAGG